MLPEKQGILLLPEKYFFAGKEHSHDASAHTACFFKNHFQTDPSAGFLLFLELDWLWHSADTLSDCHLSCGTDWLFLFESAALSGDSLVYCAAALCRGRIFSAAAVTIPLYLSLCRCRQSNHRASTEAVCLLSAFPLSAWSAAAGSVAAAVLPFWDALVFAAGNRGTGWNLVADGCVAVYHTVCFVCGWIFLASPSADCCTCAAGACTKYQLQNHPAWCIFVDGRQEKTVVWTAAAKPAALAAAALLGEIGDDADSLCWCHLQRITVCK